MVTILVAKGKEEILIRNNINGNHRTINLIRFTGGIHAGRTTYQEYGYTRTWQQW